MRLQQINNKLGSSPCLADSTPQMCAGHWHTHVRSTQGRPRTDNAAVCCCHSQPAWRILLLHEGSVRAAAAYTKLGAHQTPRCVGHTGQQLTGAENQRRPQEPPPTDATYNCTGQDTRHHTTRGTCTIDCVWHACMPGAEPYSERCQANGGICMLLTPQSQQRVTQKQTHRHSHFQADTKWGCFTGVVCLAKMLQRQHPDTQPHTATNTVLNTNMPLPGCCFSVYSIHRQGQQQPPCPDALLLMR